MEQVENSQTYPHIHRFLCSVLTQAEALLDLAPPATISRVTDGLAASR
jgi:hypothetical protein